MQQIVLTIEDQTIEKAMSEIARYEGINIQEFIIQAIKSSISQRAQAIKKLDPLQHSSTISYKITEDLSDAKPFADVKNSATFGKKLREKVWIR